MTSFYPFLKFLVRENHSMHICNCFVNIWQIYTVASWNCKAFVSLLGQAIYIICYNLFIGAHLQWGTAYS